MRFIIISTLSFALAACGSNDVCDRAAASVKKEVDEAQPCLASGQTFTYTTNVPSCKAQEGGCSDNDKKTLGIYFDCLDKLPAPTCSTTASSSQNSAAAKSYNDALNACTSSSNLKSITAACGNALNDAATTHATSTQATLP